MKRKHKTYSKPKRPFDKVRLEEEAKIKKDFGLKNKREIWKADAKIKSMREKAKKLISAEPEEQQVLFDKLKKSGLEVNSIADILSLETSDYLKRRLQTVLVAKKLTTTSKSARQLITHKKVLVGGRVVKSPSYIVPVELEDKLSLKKKKVKAKPKEVGGEAPVEKADAPEAPKEEETPAAETKPEEKKDE
jgi:small subunit ribosomal protein S4